MSKTGFIVGTPDGTGADLGDLLVRRDLFTEGGLWLWGNNNGALGDNTTISRSSPIQTIAGGNNWKQINSGLFLFLAIKTDGTLWTWGSNTYGQLGDNTTISRSSPIQTISKGTTWKQCSIKGQDFSGAIKTDGTLWLWGYNGFGQIGNNTSTHRSSPVQTISGGNNWKQLSCGGAYSLAIKTDGTLWGWGYNVTGQLGDTSSTNRSSPIQTIAGGNNWKQCSAGSNHSLALKTDGTLWVWGYNGYGELGINNSILKLYSPVQTISGGTNWKFISCGINTSAAIKTDGTLWVWGKNNNGQLGDNTIISKSSPIQTISGGNNWKIISCGSNCLAAIKTDGTLWVWGKDNYGQLGDNTIISKSSPIQTISGGNNWKQIALGAGEHMIAIKDNIS